MYCMPSFGSEAHSHCVLFIFMAASWRPRRKWIVLEARCSSAAHSHPSQRHLLYGQNDFGDSHQCQPRAFVPDVSLMSRGTLSSYKRPTRG